MMWLILSVCVTSAVLAWLLHSWLRQWFGDAYDQLPQMEWGLTVTLSLAILYLWSWTQIGERGEPSSILGSIRALALLSIIAVGWRNVGKP